MLSGAGGRRVILLQEATSRATGQPHAACLLMPEDAA